MQVASGSRNYLSKESSVDKFEALEIETAFLCDKISSLFMLNVRKNFLLKTFWRLFYWLLILKTWSISWVFQLSERSLSFLEHFSSISIQMANFSFWKKNWRPEKHFFELEFPWTTGLSRWHLHQVQNWWVILLDFGSRQKALLQRKQSLLSKHHSETFVFASS